MDIDLSVKKARRLLLWIWAIVVFAGFIAEFFQQNEEWLFTPNYSMKQRWSNGGGSEHNSI